MREVGTLSAVEVREVWADEARDFTPWLAENADLLGDALGMNLEHRETEATVGDYRADLVFHEENTQKIVVVENMFGRTDHDHLGKLITYAAGINASYAVLVAPEFRDEHRSALSWLNSVSDEEFGFFGVAIEAWRIGGSLPAPRLRVEVKPDDWSRSVKAAASESSTEQLYRRFWGEFLSALSEGGRRTPSKDRWMAFKSAHGASLKYMSAYCRPEGNRLRTEAYIDTGDAETTKAAFDRLLSQKETVESAVGEALEWDRLDNRQASRISLYFKDDIRVSEEERWPEAIDWLVDALNRLRDAINPVYQPPD